MNNTKAFKDLQAKLKKMQSFVSTAVPVIIGKNAVEFAKDNFDKQGFDTGSGVVKWADRKDSKPHNLLVDTQNLQDSLDYEIKGDKVVITSDRPYANVHNEGLRAGRGQGFTMTKRPFLAESEALKEKVENEIKRKMKLV